MKIASFPVETRVVTMDRDAFDPSIIAGAVAVLKNGGLVAFPTETVYGLGARAFDRDAIERIFEAKRRPVTHPLIAHVMGEDDALLLAASWTGQAHELANAFWPGPLTLIVSRSPRAPSSLSGGGDSIAIRAPTHPIARALISVLGEPIAAPSANAYQSISPTTAAHVKKSLDGRVDLILDGGACSGGIESTVVDVRGEAPIILRPGGIDLPTLQRVIPTTSFFRSEDAATFQHVSPGTDARHYAPNARVQIAGDRAHAILLTRAALLRGESVGVLARGPRDESLTTDGAPREPIWIELPDDAIGYAHGLYDALHQFDDAAVDAIIVESVPREEAWRSVADRLRRAAAIAEK